MRFGENLNSARFVTGAIFLSVDLLMYSKRSTQISLMEVVALNNR